MLMVVSLYLAAYSIRSSNIRCVKHLRFTQDKKDERLCSLGK